MKSLFVCYKKQRGSTLWFIHFAKKLQLFWLFRDLTKLFVFFEQQMNKKNLIEKNGLIKNLLVEKNSSTFLNL